VNTTDLKLADPLALGSFLKWGLARLVNDRGGRGFVSWELYNDFKASERSEWTDSRSIELRR